MDVRNRKVEGSRGWVIAIILALPLLAGGCATSHTHLDWGVRESPRHKTAAAARHVTPVKYAHVPGAVPTPRPTPAWYAQRPAPRDNVVVDNSPIVAGDMHFAWPMSGRIISDYGSTASGERNDGINIAAPYGEPIHAAADGTVTYVGNDLKSYGNLILISHDGNYVTAYAHAERMLVSRGEHVVKGQIIGYAGNTGDVSSPQLHFEIRRGIQPVNPHPLLVASR